MDNQNEYLIGIMYHETDSYNLWEKGIIEDYESSSGVFIMAPNIDKALSWAENIGQKILVELNNDTSLNWKEMGYKVWCLDKPDSSYWSHCLHKFPKVKIIID